MLVSRETLSAEKHLEMSRAESVNGTTKVASTSKTTSQTVKYSKYLAQNAARWNSSRNTCHIWIPSATVYSRNHEALANRSTQQEMLCGTARLHLATTNLENMLRFMTTRAGIIPHLTNHSIRATTVTVLSAATIESPHIKAIIGHQCEASI